MAGAVENKMEIASLYEYARANAFLLDFESHNEFLMTYASDRDKCFINDQEALLQILSLGYRYGNIIIGDYLESDNYTSFDSTLYALTSLRLYSSGKSLFQF